MGPVEPVIMPTLLLTYANQGYQSDKSQRRRQNLENYFMVHVVKLGRLKWVLLNIEKYSYIFMHETNMLQLGHL